ncbi:MAG: efflux RND transporter periplasmic adaptor subunit [Gammaproteobacteria bacterium]|nr:efflux RND transporter periplasmic adaptor subunit [Gammaproteobacteria bacterium]
MNKNQIFVIVVAAMILTGLGVSSGYWFAARVHSHSSSTVETTPNSASPKSERKALYWYDPMVPAQHFDKPGKSPFMDMQLVPKYASQADVDDSVHIAPQLTQNTGVKFATVETGRLDPVVEAVGSVGFNERLVSIVQARTAGIVERVYARAPNDVIPANEPLADVRVPEWYGAQAEYLALRKSGDVQLIAAARTRLQQLGMNEAQIVHAEKTGQPQAVITISSPQAGVLQEIGVRQGMTIMPGQTLARINGIDSVWLEAEVPEAQTAGLAIGTKVSAKFSAWPTREFKGRITALLPELNREARAIRVRVELPNPEGKLRPGMYARVRMNERAGRKVLLVPTEAVIATGKRNLVIVADDSNHFRPAEVKTGHEGGGKTEILEGLQEDEKIVVSGQFLIDSEASLTGVLARMEDSAKPNPTSLHEAQGKVEAISTDEVTISHGPVPSLGWPAMTMPFKIVDPKLAQDIKVGDRVQFAFHEGDAGVVIDRMEKTGAAP